MSRTIDLGPELDTIVQRRAAERGEAPEEYLLSLVEEAILFDGFEPVSEDDPQERAETIEGIKRGLADCAAGRVRPIDEAFAEMRRRHGIGR